MVAVSFYQLLTSNLETALPVLLEKVLALPTRAIVLCDNSQRVEALNNALWNYRPDQFLPHGSREDGFASDQPIYLTDQEENPNGATVLVALDKVTPDFLGGFDRCLDLFDGRDEEALAAARQRYKDYKTRGLDLTYYRQTETGWQKEG